MGRALAISLGDPAGVGPELIVEAWTRRAACSLPPFFVVDGAGLLAAAAAKRGLAVPLRSISSPHEAAATFPDFLPVLGDGNCAYTPGEPNREGAKLALSSLTNAARLAFAGEAGGLVTGPIAKARLAEIGFSYPGQTEFVAAACNVDANDAVMLLAGPNLKTVPITVHNALADVPALLTEDLIVRRAAITCRAMQRDFGMAAPRLAIAALNPHAGEDGKFGNEESAIIEPAIARLRTLGIDASGPHPADALFAPRARKTYDVALCMYHDQALIPLKALDFDEGVNMTLGLPVVRTSPDHGTAFSIAGKRIADAGAMIAAIRMAGECAARRSRA